MATTEATVPPVAEQESTSAGIWTGVRITFALTFVAILIHGYHPYAEDGGLYLTGVKWLLHPGLYPRWSEFVTAHLRFSLFAPTVAAMVRLSHLGLMTVMFLLYMGSMWLTLFAGWLIASRCTPSREGRCGAVAVLALALTIPIAGTSLMLMDPYVTARSFSTPFGLLALVGALDLCSSANPDRIERWKSVLLCVGSLALAAAAHPLMAAYSLGCVLILGCVSLRNGRSRVTATVALCLIGLAVAACLQWMAPAEPTTYAQVARTRTYWFLGMWRWYELFGLIGPLALLAWIASGESKPSFHPQRLLTYMSCIGGMAAILVATAFARPESSSYLVARLQPLRIYQPIYIVMLLQLGAVLGEHWLRRSRVRWMIAFAGVGGTMLTVQLLTFPNSRHIEFPGTKPFNAWEQGFTWVRDHTPQDASFALDADYISANGEDSANFRAIAERSAMPDYSKDGGVAAIAPNLTAAWEQGETAQNGLNIAVDGPTIARLRAAGVNWIVVARSAETLFPCAYANASVKVCRLPM